MSEHKVKYNSPIGDLCLVEANGLLERIEFSCKQNLEYEDVDKILNHESKMVLKETIKELDEYFSGKRKNFTIPLAEAKTDFSKKVRQALIEIPYGATSSYSDIAMRIENPKAARAVGNVNNKNPLPIIIPCHRVLGKNGKLVGYAGGLKIKRYLLSLEEKNMH